MDKDMKEFLGLVEILATGMANARPIAMKPIEDFLANVERMTEHPGISPEVKDLAIRAHKQMGIAIKSLNQSYDAVAEINTLAQAARRLDRVLNETNDNREDGNVG